MNDNPHPLTTVTMAIRGPDPDDTERVLDLGDFHAFWHPDGITIGSDSRCTVCLAGLAPVAAKVVAASNHKMLCVLPPGTTPETVPAAHPLPKGSQRVDYGEFVVGPYTLRFGERTPKAP